MGWTIFEIPVNQDHQETVGTTRRYDASVLYHLHARAQATLEAVGTMGLFEPGANRTAIDLAPGRRAERHGAGRVGGRRLRDEPASVR